MVVTEPQISKKFVSKKVKTVRWKPPVSNFEKANTFVVGSWDDPDNSLSLWHLATQEGDPTLIDEIPHPSNINDIQYVTRDVLAVGGGDGGIKLFQHTGTGASGKLNLKNNWKNCHSFYKGKNAPCTALATNGELVASVGEDGNLFILKPDCTDPLKVIESGGGCSDYAVVFVRSMEVLTANMQGHLKLWDLRGQDKAKSTLLSPDQVSVSYLAGHPTQNHLVAAGSEDGSLSLWDMRSTTQPLTIISAHSGPISQIQFHPSGTNHMFTCGLDGKLLHWNASSRSNAPSITSVNHMDIDNPASSVNVWFGPDVARGDVDTIELTQSNLPFNSLDIEGSTLLAGSDLEAVYIVRNTLLC